MRFNYDGGPVSRQFLEEALEFLISLEPESDSSDAREVYDRNFQIYEKEIAMAEAAIRRYGEQIEPQTLEAMRSVYYSITNSPKFLSSAMRCSIVTSTLNSCWDGIGQWRM